MTGSEMVSKGDVIRMHLPDGEVVDLVVEDVERRGEVIWIMPRDIAREREGCPSSGVR